MQINQNIFYKLKTSVPFFNYFSDEELLNLLKFSKREIFYKGAEIFKENTYGDTMYIIVSGMIDINRRIKGANQTIVILDPGNCFGEMGLIDDSPRSASAVVASEKAELLAISESILKGSGVKILYKLFHGFSRILAQRLRETNQKFTEISVEEQTTTGKLKSMVKRVADNEKGDLSNSNFSKTNLSGIFFNKTDASDSVYIESNFASSKFKGSSLEKSNFTQANFAECVIQDCNFSSSDFTATKFDRVIFRGCNFQGSRMKMAELKKVSVKDQSLSPQKGESDED